MTGIKLQVVVGNRVHQDRIPAASGMAVDAGRLFVVGDNSPLLFELDMQLNIIGSTMIREYPVDDNGLIKKKNKPDFEAMAHFAWKGEHWLLVVGSGSKPDIRERAFMISTNNPAARYESKLTALYQQFYVVGQLHSEQTLNIEGLTVANNHVYFFNRGNSAGNMIFRIPLDNVIAYITGGTAPVHGIQHATAQLPLADGFQAGFSGADFWPETGALVYSASVEATGDAYNDGEILGSYIGLLALADWQDGGQLNLTHSTQRLMQDGKVLMQKVEAIALVETGSNTANAVLACDNDDGSSEFFSAKLIAGL